MIACFDVHYEDNTANVAAILFKDWHDAQPYKEYTVQKENVAEYIPGQFYKRELPGLLHCIDQIKESIDVIIVDSFVWLDENKKGLGAYLYEALEEKIPVIGVGKTRFKSAVDVKEVFRGESKNPLFVSAVGIDLDFAAQKVKEMHGEFRFPDLLKSVDRLCRTFAK